MTKDEREERQWLALRDDYWAGRASLAQVQAAYAAACLASMYERGVAVKSRA